MFLCAAEILQILNFPPVLGVVSVRLEGQVR